MVGNLRVPVPAPVGAKISQHLEVVPLASAGLTTAGLRLLFLGAETHQV